MEILHFFKTQRRVRYLVLLKGSGTFQNLYFQVLWLTQCFFSGTLGQGPRPLELGKLATKLEFWEMSHFNKPYI